jgi:hypothetical protein
MPSARSLESSTFTVYCLAVAKAAPVYVMFREAAVFVADAAAERVIEFPEMAVIVVFAGIPAPDTAIPTFTPAVDDKVAF